MEDFDEEFNADDTCVWDDEEGDLDFLRNDYTQEERGIINLMRKIDEQTKWYMKSFFEDKEWACGGSVPDHILLEEKKINIVQQLNLEIGIDVFYIELDRYHSMYPTSTVAGYYLGDREVEEYKIEILKYVLRDIARNKIPKDRAGGFILLYLEFILGIPVRWDDISDIMSRKMNECIEAVGT